MRKYIIFLILLAIIEISLALLLTLWRENFWDAIAAKQAYDILFQLSVFTVVALIIGAVSGLSGYFISLTAIKWREILNTKARNFIKISCTNCKGTGHDVYRADSWQCYTCRGTGKADNKGVENLNQRIQEDCMSYPDLFLRISYGGVKSLTYILFFALSLCISFSWMYLITLICFSFIGTFIAYYIAVPLISLNYQQQRQEATYRNELCIENFSDCITTMLGIAKKQKHLTYFQQFFGQIAVVVPIIIIAPQYLSSAMTIGSLMRFNSVAGTILDNMSYATNAFAEINKLISCRKRLLEANIL
jgi:putative ATP-binding cassette transporter